MKYLVTILTICIICSCRQIETKKIITTYKNGKPEIVYYYKDKNDTSNYRYETFYESGTHSCIGNFINSKQNGIWTWWYENGVKLDQCKFENGFYIDTIYHWYKNGKLKQIEIKGKNKFKPGECCICNGTTIRYYENGNIKEKFTKRNDLFVDSFLKWFENGKFKLKLFYIDGKCEGTEIEYDSKGGYKISNYSNNIRDGKRFERIVDSSGVKLVEGQYEKGKETGIWYWRDKDSILLGTANYVDGKMNGEIIQYYPNGKVRVKGNMTNGENQGIEKYFNEVGKLIKIKQYKNGKIIKTIKM